MGQVTAEGYLADTFESIRDEIIAELRAEWGASVPLDDGTFDGHLIAILSERLVALDELGEIAFTSFDPDAASGVMQRVLGLITGTLETPAAGSKVTITVCGDDGTVLAGGDSGNVVSTASTGKRFVFATEVTLLQLDDWAASTAYAEGDRVNNASRCYECITAGVSAGAGGPTTTAADIVDGTAHWIYLGEGEAAADVVARSEEIGPIVAVAGDLTSRETPVAGWNTAVNLEDAELGRLAQTDEDFRLQREADVTAEGNGVPDAIRANVLAIAGVTNATVFFNNTDETVNDIPPHSCEVLVQGGDDQAIWDTLWQSVPVGIRTIGTEEGTALDADGFEQPVSFSRPEEIEVYVDVTLEKDPTTYGGNAEVKLAIATWGNAQRTGKNVVASAIAAQAFTVAGVLDVPLVEIDDAPAPSSSTTIPISKRQLAKYDTSRITVTTSDGEP